MIKSMTGFGKSRVQHGDKVLIIQLKSLNSKNLDFSLKSPAVFREKESEIRNMVAEVLSRGKVEVGLQEESSSVNGSASINKSLFMQYYSDLKSIADELGETTDFIAVVSRFPEIFKSTDEELEEDFWNSVKLGISEALKDLDDFRSDEGKTLQADLTQRIHFISEYLESLSEWEDERMDTVRDRIKKNMDEYLDPSKLNEDRLEQEMIYYLEKFDITEEKTRLRSHCAYFLETMKLDEPSGKKLGFISQELGREINTIGSKANHTEMQKKVVMMKDELEKIKEQLLNIL